MKPSKSNRNYMVWLGTPCADGRPTAWRSPFYPGVTIRRCARLFALRPYYIEGLPIARKFWQIFQAHAAVEQYERGNAPATAWFRCPICTNAADSESIRAREQFHLALIDGRRCEKCGGCGWLLKTELEYPRAQT